MLIKNNWQHIISVALRDSNYNIFFDGIDSDMIDVNYPSGYKIMAALDTEYVIAFGRVYYRDKQYIPEEKRCVINTIVETPLDISSIQDIIDRTWLVSLPWKPCIRIIVAKVENKEGD